MVKEGFKKLESTPQLLDFAKTFYWNTMNYFLAYRTLGTGLVEAKEENPTAFEKLGDAIKDSAVDIASGIPFVGGVVKMLDNAVTTILEAREKQERKDKIKIVNEVLTHNNDSILDKDVNLRVANTALLLCERLKDQIMNPKVSNSFFSKASSSLKGFIKSCKEKVLNAQNIYENYATSFAVESCIKLFA
mmetsp:Transcript_615/g.551  ORF Transcript_615/g.551 Transcript_615/m.551 type:complete len:190 (+) Transcript_615:1340-1909(+)